MYSFLLHAIRRAVREISPDLPFYTICLDELGIDLSENHPNGIVDKDRATKCHNASSLDVRRRRLHVDSSGRLG